MKVDEQLKESGWNVVRVWGFELLAGENIGKTVLNNCEQRSKEKGLFLIVR